MLRQLHISNYALIDSLEIDFTPGLNIITGETGAGKSIMLGALSLLLGARADSRAVKSEKNKSVVEATFSVNGYSALADYCMQHDIEWDESWCIIRREILPTGRSRAFINDSPVTIVQLETVSRQLIDIHSQNQNQLLASEDFQRRVLDSMSGNSSLLSQYAGEYALFRSLKSELTVWLKTIEQNRQDEEFTRFQLTQLTDARLTEGEQTELEKERDILSNMTELKETLSETLELLTNGRENVLSQLSAAVDSCEDLSEVLDDASSLCERLESARVEIQDIAETLADYDANLHADPTELEYIEQRLGLIYSLQNRFKVDTVEALIAKRDELQGRLSMLEDSDMTVDDLKKKVTAAKKQAVATAARITAIRKQVAGEFASRLEEEAKPLGMHNLRCVVNVCESELSPSGADKVEFRFAFNKNQTPVAVGGAASGGEVSRLMLCIKSIIAGKLQLPSIIFDEVDTGVSGDVANRMGLMMRAIASALQVITITHLPQVAAKGASHYKVYKVDDDSATHTRIRRLSDTERENELALMLSGSASDTAALATARSLLGK